MRLVLLVCVLLLLGVSQTTVVPHIGKPQGATPPTFKLDLDLPPEERWVNITKHFTVPLQTALGLIEFFLGPKADLFFEIVRYWGENIYYNQEMIQEIKGVAKGSMMPFGKMIFINFIYEFTTIKMCSSILVRNSTGSVLHGRNMDFFLWNRFSPLLSQVEFYKGGQYVATIYSMIGTVFALTGSKPYHFTLTEDTRYIKTGEGSFKDIVNNLIFKDYPPSAWVLRETLLQQPDWQSAFQSLQTRNVSSPIYYIISGLNANEGAVIEKKPEGVHAVYQLNSTQWFIVQSNYDRDEQDPWYDQRRAPVEKKIRDIGQNMTIEDLYSKIMCKWPTFNIATILTLSAVPSLGYTNITAWYGVTEA